jgi:hypothetical protein
MSLELQRRNGVALKRQSEGDDQHVGRSCERGLVGVLIKGLNEKQISPNAIAPGTAKSRRRYDHSQLRSPSDLTDEEWLRVEPMIPPAKVGRNRRGSTSERL